MSYGTMPGRYPAIVKTYDQARRTCRIEIPGITDGGDVLPEAEIEYPVGDKSRDGTYTTELEILAGDTVWVAFIGGDPRYPIITGYRNPQAGNSADWRRYHHKNYELLTDVMMHFESQETIKADAAKLAEVTSGETINIDSQQTITEKAGNTTSREAGTSYAVKAGDSITAEAGSTITIKAGSKITLSVGGSTVEISAGSVAITSGQISLNGPITGGGGGGATATFNGPVHAKQDVKSDGDVVAGGISLMNHVHTEQGDGAETSGPH